MLRIVFATSLLRYAFREDGSLFARNG
jgi:hypothetical protein